MRACLARFKTSLPNKITWLCKKFKYRPQVFLCLFCGWCLIWELLSSGEGRFRRRKTSQKISTSDHGGFAEVQPHATQPPPASIPSPELSSRAQVCPPMSAPLIGAGSFLRLRGPLPEENIQKDHHLRPQQLRRSSAARHASSSGEHSLARVQPPATRSPPANIRSPEESSGRKNVLR